MIAFVLLMGSSSAFFSIFCCVASLIDYFSPPNPRLNRICRMLLIFRDVLSGALGLREKKSF